MKNLALSILFAFTNFLSACAPSIAEPDVAGIARSPSNLTLGDSFLSEFYRYDGQLKTPGKLLRKELLNDQQSNPGAAQNFRLLYSSTDGLDGQDLLPVSGVLFLPEGKAPNGGWPLMAWTHGTVGIADICAPSWNGRQKQDQDHIQFWLTNGYAVVASDYQGLGTPGTHPYLATRPEAYSNLDIIRAVQAADFPVSDKVVLFGQSQGAGAAIATAAYAPDYAPEIKIVGAVATGVPFFSPKALIALQESRPPDRVDPMLAYNMLALSLVQRTDPSFELTDYMTKEALPIARSIENTCHKDVRAKVGAQALTYNSTFTKSPSDHLTKAFSRMGYPTLRLSIPTFVGTGGQDNDTPPRMQTAFIKRACQAGSTIVSKLYPNLDHRGVVPGSTGDTLPFVKAVFAGNKISTNCDNLAF